MTRLRSDTLRRESNAPGLMHKRYVSLFGLSGLNDIKLKLIQSAVPHMSNFPAASEKLQTPVAVASKFLKSFDKRFSALDELALLAVPSLLKGKVIVLDDLGRKHEKLNIDEVLGFIG